MASVILVIVVYDMRHTIIPDEAVIALTALAFILLGYKIFAGIPDQTFLNHILSGFGASAFFGSLWYVSKGRWIGLGDAKLAFPFGIVVGFPLVFSTVILSFWIGAVLMLLILGVQKLLKKWKTKLSFLSQTLTIKSEVPFAPFLVLGYIFTHLLGINIFDITLLFFS